MKRYKNIGFVVLIILSAAPALSQGAWHKEKGKGFFKLAQSSIISDQFYSPEGTIQDIKTAGVHITSLYGEYGLSDRWTVAAYVPFFFRNTINEQEFAISPNVEAGDESNSFGDTDIAIQYGILKKGPWVLSTSLLLGLPLGETSGGTSGVLQSGDGEFNQLLRVHGGYSFYPAPFWAAGYAGFNNRTQDFSDEVRFGAEVGVTVGSNFFAVLKLDIVESLMNGEAATSQTGIFSNNLEFTSFGPELSYVFDNGWGISAAAFGALNGQNILASPAFSIGLVYDLK
ncbi:MAG: hypothetical protein AAGA85_02510 [Bacteroidota bacterium]